MEKLEMRLDLFGETEAAAPTASAPEAGAAPESASAAGTGENAGVNALPAREGRRPNIFPAVPKQEVRRVQPKPARQLPTVTQQAQQPAQKPQAAEETFEDAIRGRWAKEYGEHVRAAVQERFKGREEQDKRYESAMQALVSIAPMYGMNADDPSALDLDKLVNAIREDDRLYEQAALEKGIPVETEKHIRQMEMREKQRQAQERRSLEIERLQKHIAGLREQEKELKQEFPDFDLTREAQNPAFERMIRPDGGLTVRQAYMAVHGDELLRSSRQETENSTKRAMSQAIQAGAMRPQENGLAQQGGGAPQRDPRSYTREERAEIRRRVMAGERGIRP